MSGKKIVQYTDMDKCLCMIAFMCRKGQYSIAIINSGASLGWVNGCNSNH